MNEPLTQLDPKQKLNELFKADKVVIQSLIARYTELLLVTEDVPSNALLIRGIPPILTDLERTLGFLNFLTMENNYGTSI